MKKNAVVLLFSLALACFVSSVPVKASEESPLLGFFNDIYNNSSNGGGEPSAQAGTEYSDTAETGRAEVGFATPKEAAEAYIYGFCELDYEKMMSACAVETYVERYDLEKWVETIKLLPGWQNLENETYIPFKDPMSTMINIDLRRSRLNKMILLQFYTVMSPDQNQSDFSNLKDNSSSAANPIQEIYGDGRVPEIIFRGEFLSPILFSDRYFLYHNITWSYTVDQIYGMTRSISLMAVIYRDGIPCFMVIDTGCYDGRWYVTDSTNLASYFYNTEYNNNRMLIPTAQMYPGEKLTEYRDFFTGLLSNETLMNASSKIDEAFLNLDVQSLIMNGEADEETADKMIETTLMETLTPQELELINEYKGTLLNDQQE